jgi:hypothetical protein
MKKNFLRYLVLILPFLMLFPLGACSANKTLAVGDTFKLGPITVEVTKIDESTVSQVFWSSSQSGMKFVMVELNILSNSQFGDFSTLPVFIEFSSGNQYGSPTIYARQSFGQQQGMWEYIRIEDGEYYNGNWHQYQGELGFGDLNLLFQVNYNESLTTLIKLGYQETAT